MINIIIGSPPPLFFFNISCGIDKPFREICVTTLLHWSEDPQQWWGKKQRKTKELGNFASAEDLTAGQRAGIRFAV